MYHIKRAATALLVAGAVSTLAPAKPAAAALAFNQATITTTITVANVCSFLTNQSYTAIFTYDPINANVTTAPAPQTVALKYVCTNGDATDKFSFDGGVSYSGSTRRAKGTASTPNYINYNLYTDAAATASPIAQNGTVTAAVGTGYIPGTPLTTSVYVGVPAGQSTVTADTYTDVVTVTINP
jgi:spore coat protein U-like protein